MYDEDLVNVEIAESTILTNWVNILEHMHNIKFNIIKNGWFTLFYYLNNYYIVIIEWDLV